jgi:hypothetical protein
MRNKLLHLALLLSTLFAPVLAQPWLECAERYLPAVVDEESREAYRSSLVHAYARNGEFARAQALIDGVAAERKNDLGVMAAIGALRGEHVDQALRWAEIYLPKTELAWDRPEHLTRGSDRERFLRSPRSPESAARVLEFMRAHGGVSPSSLVFVLRETGGMSLAVSDYYLREFAKVADQARPIEWIQIEESVEASGPEFAPLRDRILEVMLKDREQLVEELSTTTKAKRATAETGMTRYAATLLARHGRFQEAEEMWRSAGPADLPETKLFLQSMYLGGRKQEALAELIKITGMEEDAKVQLSLFLFGLGHYEEVKALGTDPEDYVNMRIAKRDLQRDRNVDRWLAFIANLDANVDPVDSTLFELAHDLDMPAGVRQKAKALLPDLAGSTKIRQSYLMKSIEKLPALESARMTLMLLILDDDIHEAGCFPSPEGLEAIEAICANAPL